MSQTKHEATEHLAVIIHRVIDDAFTSIKVLHEAVLACHAAAERRAEPLCGDDISGLRDIVCSLLADPDHLLVGLGLVVAPDVLCDEPLRLEWWQRITSTSDVQPLVVDLDPDSLHFYDYAATEWFAVPRDSGARHVVGPYVDVFGTGRYLLTLTAPVIAGGRFIGIVGADVSVQRFETRVLRELGGLHPEECELIVLGAERRVVLSTSTRWLTGDLLPPEPHGAIDGPPATYQDLADVPWTVRVADAHAT